MILNDIEKELIIETISEYKAILSRNNIKDQYSKEINEALNDLEKVYNNCEYNSVELINKYNKKIKDFYKMEN